MDIILIDIEKRIDKELIFGEMEDDINCFVNTLYNTYNNKFKEIIKKNNLNFNIDLYFKEIETIIIKNFPMFFIELHNYHQKILKNINL